MVFKIHQTAPKLRSVRFSGRRTVLITKQAVKNDQELLNHYSTLVTFRCDDDTVESVYKDFWFEEQWQIVL